MHAELRETLKARAGELSQQVLNRMYENPFWMERYGERGRQYADQDSLYHLQYLDAALAADDAHVFEKYARWLRDVLVSRGMCSEHLAENFRLVAEALANLPSASPATAILDRGVQTLVYAEGDAARLEAARPSLQAAVNSAPGAESMRDDDRRYLVSYLIDAAATGERTHFDTFASRCPAAVVQALNGAVTAL